MEKLYLKESRSWIFVSILNRWVIGLLFAVVILLSYKPAQAQMECRSMIGAHMTPFSDKVPILWALEGTMAPGLMTSPYDSLGNAKLNGGMLLAALEFNFGKKSSFYFEGGYKNWSNSALVDDSLLKKSRHIGMRQVYYSYATENTKVKIGLHETRLGDYFLVDERILGVSVDQTAGAFTFNVRGGTVMKNFARMGQFCSNRHLYGVIHPDYTEKIGGKPGETNLAGIVVNWDPHYSKSSGTESSGDEFSDSGDEFIDSEDENHENHDFNEFGGDNEFEGDNDSEAKVRITNIGFILYDEFGSESFIPDNKLYTGAMFDVELPAGFILQTGAVYQNMNLNNTVVYIAKFAKSVTWDNASNTKVSGAYIGKFNIDDNAIFQPLFSNLFLGEIMRMDAPDFPLWQGAIKHRFPGKMKFHMAVKAVGQIEGAKTNEQDIEAGILVFKNHLKVTLIGSHVQSDYLPNDFFTARLEMRLAF